MIIQIFLLLFVAFAILKTIGRFRKKEITAGQVFFWCLVWITIAFATIFPQWTVIAANKFGVGRGTDFVLYVAVALLLYIVFRLTVRIQKINRDITKIVRKDALQKSNKQ